jgi:hypothetical protein
MCKESNLKTLTAPVQFAEPVQCKPPHCSWGVMKAMALGSALPLRNLPPPPLPPPTAAHHHPSSHHNWLWSTWRFALSRLCKRFSSHANETLPRWVFVRKLGGPLCLGPHRISSRNRSDTLTQPAEGSEVHAQLVPKLPCVGGCKDHNPGLTLPFRKFLVFF